MASKQQQDREPEENEYQSRYPGGVPVHSGGTMIQWEKVGQEVVGTFSGIKPFKNGHIANVATEEGSVAFSAPSLLAEALQRIKPGARVAIVFKGERPNKKKGLNAVKLFEVYQLPDDR